MSYFLAPHSLTLNQTFSLKGEEGTHLLKSRRMAPGERFFIQSPDGSRYEAKLLEKNRNEAVALIIEAVEVPPLPKKHLTLMVGAPKTTDWIVQKSSELGTTRIWFFYGTHSPMAQKELLSTKTQTRWEKIAWEACKQSDRQFPPEIRAFKNLVDALKAGEENTEDLRWLLDAQGPPPDPGKDDTGAWALIGPEGGLTQEERALAVEAQFEPVSLGSLILRTETAALTASALLLHG